MADPVVTKKQAFVVLTAECLVLSVLFGTELLSPPVLVLVLLATWASTRLNGLRHYYRHRA
ncbi:hypothetical protein [Haloarchaeobius sp. HME9146]|uniref:hypothetical protein n=1 Tax=Haloarchaeobius sp. HME9146 TaxID=2978732 RepID=UPI0021C04889|nr:hypothetical protein [Haloarchaeobius sp. HME9146]MCT9097901.1 hypothetical protein [Haloarchaeobius sp. HME9146]